MMKFTLPLLALTFAALLHVTNANAIGEEIEGNAPQARTIMEGCNSEAGKQFTQCPKGKCCTKNWLFGQYCKTGEQVTFMESQRGLGLLGRCK